LKLKINNSKFVSSNSNQNFIKFIWIHIGITGNGKVDLLIKEVTNEMPILDIRVPLTDFFKDFKIHATLSTNTLIKEQSQIKGTDYFLLFHEDDDKPCYAEYGLSRDFVNFVSRCRSNYHNLNASLDKLTFIADSACQCGAQSPDLNHVI
jgi:hypothetical protein